MNSSLTLRIHVLHAFQKKSKSGIKTPRADVELVETRLKAVQAGYQSEKGMTMTRKLRTRGTDNVLVDLGFDDAEELSVKAVLAMKLNALLEAHGLTKPKPRRF